VRRVAVVGSSGAGKTWLASRLAAALGVPHVELDAIHHGPGWVALPAETMQRRIELCCPADGAWVADGNYSSKGGDVLRARADVVVWVDLPRRAVMCQLSLRTLRRVALRERLWNGNRESLRNVVAWDPERSILRWAWTRHEPTRAGYAAQADTRWVRLTSRAEMRRFLAAATASRGPASSATKPTSSSFLPDAEPWRR
jgi:adenylate kinase family enzyme